MNKNPGICFVVSIMVMLISSTIYANDQIEDGFGVVLPEGITSRDIIKLMVPKTRQPLATLIGMKKWPYRQNSYVAIVCLSTSVKEFESDTSSSGGKPCCKACYGDGTVGGYNPKEVYLAMVEYSGKPKIIAEFGKPLAVSMTSENSQLDGPEFIKNGSIFPFEYQKFDFAKYKISDNQVAFGIRVRWNEGYAGGGADYVGLMLFMIDGNKIINICNYSRSTEHYMLG